MQFQRLGSRIFFINPSAFGIVPGPPSFQRNIYRGVLRIVSATYRRKLLDDPDLVPLTRALQSRLLGIVRDASHSHDGLAKPERAISEREEIEQRRIDGRTGAL